MPQLPVRPVCTLMFSLALMSCGGGGGTPAPPAPAPAPVPVPVPVPMPVPVPVPPPPVASYSITTSHDAGSGIAPASAVVEAGKSTSFTVTVLAGYAIKGITGADGTLAGNVYTTAPVTGNATVTVTTARIDDRFSIADMRISPRALFDDEFKTAPVTIEVTASGKGFTLYAAHFANWFDRSLAGAYVSEQLYDDGTHGDRIANDGIHTRIVVPGMTPRLRYHDRSVDALSYNIEARDAAGNNLSSLNPVSQVLSLGVVSRGQAVATTAIASGVFAAPNMVNVVMPGYGASGDDLATVSKRIYDTLPDLFDAQVMYALGGMTGNNIPFHIAVKSSVQGINFTSTLDTSATYGSAGKLQQIIDFKGNMLGAEFNHEFGHQWGFYLSQPALDLTRDSVFGGTVDFHIGSPSTLLGQMGSNLYLTEQANGDFLVTPAPGNNDFNGRKFADLELYLMGLVPPSAVAPYRFVLDSSVTPAMNGILPRNKTALVGIDDIIRVYGPRLPAAATSQKAFRALFVGVSDKPMTAAEIAIINRTAAYYAGTSSGGAIDAAGPFEIITPHSFNSATSGLATLETTVPPKK